MGARIVGGKFQSDKYPTTPPGKVPLSVEDETAQDLLWEYAQRRRSVDAEFSDDLESALLGAGFEPAEEQPRGGDGPISAAEVAEIAARVEVVRSQARADRRAAWAIVAKMILFTLASIGALVVMARSGDPPACVAVCIFAVAWGWILRGWHDWRAWDASFATGEVDDAEDADEEVTGDRIVEPTTEPRGIAVSCTCGSYLVAGAPPERCPACGAEALRGRAYLDYAQPPWDDLDAGGARWGVFSTEAESAYPHVILPDADACERWIENDRDQGDDSTLGGLEVCILPIFRLSGLVWNSFDPVVPPAVGPLCEPPVVALGGSSSTNPGETP